jgi:Cu-Zn family superoxide dismutase
LYALQNEKALTIVGLLSLASLVSRYVLGQARLWPPARRTFIFVAALVSATAVFATAGALAQVPAVGASAEVKDASGRVVANADFREGRGEVLVTIMFPSPAALTGTHGLRIHEVGRCDPPAFVTAGGGFNPFGKKHGRQNPEGPQVGDLPNVNFTTGLTSYNTTALNATLGAGPGSLLGPNKTSLIIYERDDDQNTDPDGKAGARIACGIINPATGASAPPVVGQPQVPKPAVSPVPPLALQPAPPAPTPTRPVAAQPVVPKPAASVIPTAVPAASPLVVQPAAPPPAAAAQPAQPSSGGTGIPPLTAFIIAVLGVGLVGAGWLLRRRGQV